MPLYHYKALNARGELLEGRMEAVDEREVAQRLQEQGHLPVEARPAGEGGGAAAWKSLWRPRPFAGARLVPFTQQLAAPLGAGRPLDRALASLLELRGGPAARRTLGGGGGAGAGKSLWRPRPFAGARLVQFTQQLATLLGAGQPLDRALTILLELPEEPAARRTIAEVRDAVRGGASLSTALERQHDT